MTKRRINVSVESIMVILLMIIFAASICVLIFEGSRTYQKILNNKDQEENIRIALSYVNMRLKQNDVKDSIEIVTDDMAQSNVLVIHHHDDEEGLKSFIYYKDGYLWECYTDKPLDHSLSSEIIPLAGIDFIYQSKGSQIVTTISYDYGDELKELSQLTTLRAH